MGPKFNTDNNGLRGSIPSELRALIQLEVLGLANNQLVGEIPPRLMESLASTLVELDVEKNQLQGNPLAQLDYTGVDGEVTLRDLKLSNNLFEGPIVGTTLSQLSNLEKLWIAENSFEGTIPTEIGSLSNLGMLAVILYQLV